MNLNDLDIWTLTNRLRADYGENERFQETHRHPETPATFVGTMSGSAPTATATPTFTACFSMKLCLAARTTARGSYRLPKA